MRVDGPAQVTRLHPGIIRIAPAEGNETVVYRSSGLGIVPGWRGATLGFSRETVVALRGERACQIILFDPTQQNVEALVRLLQPIASRDQICNVGEK